MSSMNKVILIGNLGADVESREMPGGGKVANLSLATSETWKDKTTGERREKTEWHRVTIWAEPLVDIATKYLGKGSKICVEGKLETRKWQDQSGNDRYSTEVVLRPFDGKLYMLGGGKSGGASQDGGQARTDDFPDDIPF